MTKFEKWFVRRVIRKEVRQGPDHAYNIAMLYKMVRNACNEEFTEDNALTMDYFLREQFERTQFDNRNKCNE